MGKGTECTCFSFGGQGWGAEREKVTHLSVTMCSIFSDGLVTFLSGRPHLLSSTVRANSSLEHTALNLGGFLFSYLLINKTCSCQATSLHGDLALVLAFRKHDSSWRWSPGALRPCPVADLPGLV